MKFVQFVFSPHPSDISRLKKFVPLSPMRFRTFVAANNVRKGSGEIRKFASDDATLLTLGCTDASIVPLSLNRSVGLRNRADRKAPEKGYCAVIGQILRSTEKNTAQ